MKIFCCLIRKTQFVKIGLALISVGKQVTEQAEKTGRVTTLKEPVHNLMSTFILKIYCDLRSDIWYTKLILPIFRWV